MLKMLNQHNVSRACCVAAGILLVVGVLAGHSACGLPLRLLAVLMGVFALAVASASAGRVLACAVPLATGGIILMSSLLMPAAFPTGMRDAELWLRGGLVAASALAFGILLLVCISWAKQALGTPRMADALAGIMSGVTAMGFLFGLYCDHLFDRLSEETLWLAVFCGMLPVSGLILAVAPWAIGWALPEWAARRAQATASVPGVWGQIRGAAQRPSAPRWLRLGSQYRELVHGVLMVLGLLTAFAALCFASYLQGGGWTDGPRLTVLSLLTFVWVMLLAWFFPGLVLEALFVARFKSWRQR